MMTVEHDFVKFALRNYHPVVFTEDDFLHDLNKIVVLKKLFKRYTSTGTINERLVLNNIIILMNVFGVKATNSMLFHRVNPEHWSILKTFLSFLNSYVETVETMDVPVDSDVKKLLGDPSCLVS
jgi:hypothetical protein